MKVLSPWRAHLAMEMMICKGGQFPVLTRHFLGVQLHGSSVGRVEMTRPLVRKIQSVIVLHTELTICDRC